MSELLAAARELFAQDGYSATSLEAVAAAAGVTKGALYHHFAGKRELFRAVFEEEERKLGETTARAYRKEADPWDGFYAACRAFLQASADPAVQRITLLDAPSALGTDTIREIEADGAFANTVWSLERAMEAGRIPKRPVEPLAQLLYGAICSGAGRIARSENPQAELRAVLSALRGLLDALAGAA